MVQGPRTKTRKPPSHHLDYIVHIQEIKPWPPSHSLKAIRAVLIQWEQGDRNSGLTSLVAPSVESGSGLGDGKIKFNDSFKLPVTLTRDISMKSGNGNNFQKNCIQFNLYEPRRDKTVKKGQLIGTAVLDLAEYGVVKESFSISVPLNCKRTYSNSAQPLLFIKIQSVQRTRAGSSSREGLTREGSNAFEEYVEEAEVASCTTDDDVSSQSSVPVTLGAVELNATSSPQDKDNGTVAINSSAAGESKSVEDQATKVNDGDIHENDANDDTTNYQNDQETEIYQNHKKYDAYPSNGLSQANVQNQAPLENGTEEKIKVNGTFSNIDRSKNMKSVRSLSESSRNKDAKTYLKEPEDGLSDSRVELLERRMRIMEGELREAAAIEISLYSVIAEHISSVNKVHAPARRLSRLYVHASKQNSKSRQGSAAKSIVSGLVLVSKACGNDVPRLTFWLSNSIVLRVIMSKLFGDDKLPTSVGPVNGTSGNGNKKSSKLKWDSFPIKGTRSAVEESFGDWENPLTFVVALEKVEAWIFYRIIESIWWQTFTPHMQSGNAKEIRRSLDSKFSMSYKRTSIDQQQGSLSMELWKKAFKDACERICPVRAGGHDCGCLLVLSRVIIEQLIARLDVAMFNAILRESADEIPTDPVADPISDAEVLPIPAGKASFGAGAQLKNAIGNWSRWLTDLFGIDDDDLDENADEAMSNDTSSKPFHLLNALSDLMMLPKDLLLSQTVRKEVCPTFGPPIIRRVLNYFVPDEFCPDPIPNVVLEALNSEDSFDFKDDPIANFPCAAAPIIYHPPSSDSVANVLGEFGSQSQLTRSRSSLLKKSQTSDDELDELDSPLKSVILLDNLQLTPSSSGKAGLMSKENGSGTGLRYQLLRDVWMECD